MYDAEYRSSGNYCTGPSLDTGEPRFLAGMPFTSAGAVAAGRRSRGSSSGFFPLEAQTDARDRGAAIASAFRADADPDSCMGNVGPPRERNCARRIMPKDQFLATLSHELRTPLNAVLGWVNMLRTGAVQDERRGHALEVVERNARAQVQLIEDLLDTSRILMGRCGWTCIRCRSGRRSSQSWSRSGQPQSAKGVSLHGPEHRDLGSPTILADAGRFDQIVSNLLSNAIKFTPPGGNVWLNLTCEASNCGCRCMIPAWASIRISSRMCSIASGKLMVPPPGHTVVLEWALRSFDTWCCCTAGPSKPSARDRIGARSLSSGFRWSPPATLPTRIVFPQPTPPSRTPRQPPCILRIEALKGVCASGTSVCAQAHNRPCPARSRRLGPIVNRHPDGSTAE